MQLLDSIASNANSYTDLNPPAGDIYYNIETLHPVGCDVSRSGYNSSKLNKSTSTTIEIPDISSIPRKDYINYQSIQIPPETL